MNRQFRRAQEKQDKKQEKEKARRREDRRTRARRLRGGRKKASPAPKAGSDQGSAGQDGAADTGAKRTKGGRTPGRFAGVLAAITVFFVTLQGLAPAEEEQTLGASLVSAGFYLMLGYFATLYFMRRGVARAPLMSVVGGALLATSVTVTALLQGRELDELALVLVLPALAAGALLGRLVFVATPR